MSRLAVPKQNFVVAEFNIKQRVDVEVSKCGINRVLSENIRRDHMFH
jgi:hypothetical protein